MIERMTYEEFTNAIERKVMDYFKEKTTVRKNEVKKNNGITLVGMTIMEEDCNITPTIYLEKFYEDYQNGVSLDDITEKLINIYKNNKPKNNYDIEYFKNYDLVYKNIVYKLINKKKNKELLKEIPYFDYLDMAIVFYYMISDNMFGDANILIHNSHLKLWKITKEQIYADALKNTPINLEAKIYTMSEIMKDVFAENITDRFIDEYSKGLNVLTEDEINSILNKTKNNAWINEMAEEMTKYLFEQEEDIMYVLTNEKKQFGAACILYKNVLDDFADKMNNDLYILPSSIHEVIIVPAQLVENAAFLQDMVKEVNYSEVAEEEILTDSIYYYDRNKQQLQLFISA